MPAVATGLDRVLDEPLAVEGRGRVAVLCNATTVSHDWLPTVEALLRVPGLRVERIFSPQHGFASEKQDNMVESPDERHPRLGLPIVSLYSDTRVPRPGALDGLDAVIVDLQDVGTRVYTFAVTALNLLEVAHAAGVPVIVLDRPNPIGGRVEGPVLREAFASFVGRLDVPLRHGLTLGELCLYGAAHLGLIEEARVAAGVASRRGRPPAEVDLPGLRVVPVVNASRDRCLDELGLPWIAPSPNLPTLAAALVYPGQVAWEGTALSEGRGTTQPFELFGAPYLDPPAVVQALMRAGAVETGAEGYAGAARGREGSPLAGLLLRDVHFEPSFHKHAHQRVRGFQLHVLDRPAAQPVSAVIALLQAVRDVHDDAFAWRQPPYEYEWDRLAVDLIFGTDAVRRALESGAPAEEIIAAWRPDLDAYAQRIAPYRIYDIPGSP